MFAWEPITSAQLGLISRDQARTCGLGRKQIDGLLRRGTWIRSLPSVYRVAGAGTPWPHALMAAHLWAGERAVLSHQSAAALWGFSRFSQSDVVLSGLCNLEPIGRIVYHRVRRLDHADLSTTQKMRVTSVARTLLDLAGEPLFEKALDEGLRRRLVREVELEGCLERNGKNGKPFIGRFAALVTDRIGGGSTDSDLETEVVTFLRQRRLPSAQRQYAIVEDSRLVAQVDFAWPAARVVLLAHGGSIHRQRHTWELDQQVENQLAALGWFVAKVSRQMLREQPAELEGVLRRALFKGPRQAFAPTQVPVAPQRSR